MPTSNEHTFLLTDLLPQYRSVNALYRETVERSVLSFDVQCDVTVFYNEFNDIQAFEKAILNFLLSADKERQLQIIANLQTEIGKNIEIYTANKTLFDGFDTIKVCSDRYNPLENEVRGQLKDTNNLWQELTQVKNSLESASWNNDKIRIERLTKEHKRLEDLYKKEQKKLEALYQQQKESDNHAAKNAENVFAQICGLSSTFASLLNNYFLAEKTLTSGAYFDMQLVSQIYSECNDIQFDSLSEVDLYALLNLKSANTKLTIKSGERTRMCYLIFKLYEHLKTDNRAEWRTAILESIGIREDYYKSKYKEPVSEVPSRKSNDFSQRIDRIFKECP